MALRPPRFPCFQYRAVFIFDRLPLKKDGVRTEDEALAAQIDAGLEADYRSVGYRPVRVPVLSIEKRTDFVLEYIRSGKTFSVA
jgi:predicted ATPase